MGLDPAHLEVTENSATTSQTAGTFPMLVLGPKAALTHLLYSHALYIWVNSYCLAQTPTKQGCGPARAGRQILLRRSKAAPSERWKTTEKRGAASPEDTHRGMETGKAPSRASKQHHSFLPAADVAGQCARPEMPSRQPGTEIWLQPKPAHMGSQSCRPAP